ncbi:MULTISPECIES: hypothetical protein [Niastella]|uniref:Uncharacterized protein n=1 Tax=Niastella soli TaxID=2821487 RepID=A0ABS3YQX4_9BACT|nr:hypothetical protein [Niastella soli]MBO9200311.1 hypothetical protein [Niastella soli]
MKRIETPLQASILLDAFNCPITLTGNIALQVQSPQWLRVKYTCITNPSLLLASFFSVFSFTGYNHLMKKSSGVRTSAYLKPID